MRSATPSGGWLLLSRAKENGAYSLLGLKQRLFRPVHDWAMAVLRRLPCDGTFHQEAPAAGFRSEGYLFL